MFNYFRAEFRIHPCVGSTSGAGAGAGVVIILLDATSVTPRCMEIPHVPTKEHDTLLTSNKFKFLSAHRIHYEHCRSVAHCKQELTNK